MKIASYGNTLEENQLRVLFETKEEREAFDLVTPCTFTMSLDQLDRFLWFVKVPRGTAHSKLKLAIGSHGIPDNVSIGTKRLGCVFKTGPGRDTVWKSQEDRLEVAIPFEPANNTARSHQCRP